MGCLQRLRAARPRAGRSAALLIDFILSNPEAAAGLTIAGLSEGAGVSESTVCRLLPGLGYGGVAGFREALSRDAAQLRAAYDQSDYRTMAFLDFYGQPNVAAALCDLYASVIENCRGLAGGDAVAAAADRLLGGRFTYFVGQGTSAVSAHYAYIRFYRLGLLCGYEDDAMLMRQRAALLERGDVLFAISASGRTRAVVDCARMAADNGATVVTLSDYERCPLSRRADVPIFTTRRQQGGPMGEDFPLIVGQIAMLDLVHAAAFARAPERARALYLKTREVGDGEKQGG
ncbi:MAG: MurR/RpiR family transcriptional regulator [Clostridiales bacterium]|nr:MurR/RpiR family transcriptional regulator [Clostridiales bacterium]